MFGLISRVAKREQIDRATAEDQYFHLLDEAAHEGAQPDENIEDQLYQVMADLGKTSAQVQADLQLIVQARELQKAILDGSNLATEQKARGQERDAYVKESERLNRERIEQSQRLTLAASAVEQKRIHGMDSAHRLEHLKSHNPALLRKIEVLAFVD